jgi:hypothetical protein
VSPIFLGFWRELALGSNVTAAPRTRAGAAAVKRGSMRTAPVNQSAGPLPDGFDPARVMSSSFCPSVRGEAAIDRQPDADHEARGRAALAFAASESAKMKGQDQNATEPARHRAQSAKMHKQHPTQNPSSQSGSGTVNTEGTTQK